ncbi:MAG: ABC transporter permease [Gemmatimonadota bacterium]|jgi:ABC-type lipoprotein release transport system permease subunit|nr:MAG: ABC transporter permease [Gemmatimonadota bacterium]
MSRILLMARLALRNLRRQARRSMLTAAAMIVGGGLLIFSVSLGDGTHEDWIESGVRTGSGHIAIQAPDYRISRKIDDRLGPGSLAAARSALGRSGIAEHVVDMAPKLASSALASSPIGARPVQVIGVDPSAEARFSTLDDKVIEGRYLEPKDRLAAYIGVRLAEQLEVDPGSRLVLTAQDAEGEIAGQLARVVGVFRTGIPEVDQGTVHIPLGTAGSWLKADDAVTTLAVVVDRSRAVSGITRQLRDALAAPIAAGDVSVLTWREAMPELDAAVKVDDLGNYLFQGITFGIIGLAIVNTILMSVLYRHREFGVLQALGFTPGQTGALVMAEGVVLTVLSGLVGIGAGLFITWFFWRDGLDISFTWQEDWTFSGVVLDPVIVPLFRTARVVQGLVFILLVGTLASLYPAYRATRIDVAEAMKFER